MLRRYFQRLPISLRSSGIAGQNWVAEGSKSNIFLWNEPLIEQNLWIKRIPLLSPILSEWYLLQFLSQKWGCNRSRVGVLIVSPHTNEINREATALFDEIPIISKAWTMNPAENDLPLGGVVSGRLIRIQAFAFTWPSLRTGHHGEVLSLIR